MLTLCLTREERSSPTSPRHGQDESGSLGRLQAEKTQLEALLHALPDISFIPDRQDRYLQLIGGRYRCELAPDPGAAG